MIIVLWPTGHRIVTGPRKCEEQKMVEPEDARGGETNPRQCWRDPKLVRKLTGLRKKLVTEQWRKAKMKLKEEMRWIGVECQKKEVSQAWNEVHNMRKEVWSRETPKHTAKVDHLLTRSKICVNHKTCKECDNIWANRNKMKGAWSPKVEDQNPEGTPRDSSPAGNNTTKSSNKDEDTTGYEEEKNNTSPDQYTSQEEGLVERLLNKMLKEKKEMNVKKVRAHEVIDKISCDESGTKIPRGEEGVFNDVKDCLEPEEEDTPKKTSKPKGGRPVELRKEYLSRENHLKVLEKECELIKMNAKKFNEDLTRIISKNRMEERTNPELDKSDEVLIFGNVSLSEEEMEVQKLGPGYMLVSTLEEEDMRTETTVALTKIMWDMMKDGRESMTCNEIEVEDNEKSLEELESERMNAEELDRELRDVLSENGETLNMRKTRASDMRGNRNVIMPPPGTPINEAEHNMRGATWFKQFNDFKTENCDKKGNQRVSNLTRRQEVGLKTLKKKVSKLECIILATDKGKTFVVVDEPTYVAMSQDHVSNDPVVSPAEIRESQSILSSTAKSLVNILNLGSSHGKRNYSRCFENSGSTAEDVPNLKLLPKTHKPPAPGGHPQSRPVVAAASGLSSRAGTS